MLKPSLEQYETLEKLTNQLIHIEPVDFKKVVWEQCKALALIVVVIVSMNNLLELTQATDGFMKGVFFLCSLIMAPLLVIGVVMAIMSASQIIDCYNPAKHRVAFGYWTIASYYKKLVQNHNLSKQEVASLIAALNGKSFTPEQESLKKRLLSEELFIVQDDHIKKLDEMKQTMKKELIEKGVLPKQAQTQKKGVNKMNQQKKNAVQSKLCIEETEE